MPAFFLLFMKHLMKFPEIVAGNGMIIHINAVYINVPGNCYSYTEK